MPATTKSKPKTGSKKAASSGSGSAGGKKSSSGKSSSSKDGAKKSPAKKSAAAADGNYTKPALRDRLKKKIQAGEKGGRAGQWSARKSQLLTHEYEAAGGDYKSEKRTASQKSLKQWTEQDWQTADGKPAARGKKETARYLPKKAWDKLSPAEKKATDKKKRAGSRAGKQNVSNTAAAKKARRKAE